MISSTRAVSGDGGISGVGETVSIVQNNFSSDIPRILKRSVIFDICQIIAESDINYDDDYSIQHNSDWMEKLSYNNVEVYVDIFDNYSDGYKEISDILQHYIHTTKMVKKIRTVYLEHRGYDDNINGDQIIKEVFECLKEEICDRSQLTGLDLVDEEVDEAIYLIMFYAFTKCKLLKPVPVGSNYDN
ncbi:hypothetical protein [Lactococcus garvieae]|uniref:Uncharacterized protein n=1 Tax=Lactococcus garvieae TaxID=1363 RepID=A0AA46YUI1_9LACT|nr:hypothetical protein [Lactococcus garvieae]UYT10393.1 hypothetical protein OF801_00195 [Lactococcus garvieae]UYT12434.1 hypothetical protein OF800_00200 [Lactococcus garvieae]